MLFLISFVLHSLSINVAVAETKGSIDLACGLAVAFRYQKEIKSVEAVDKYYHCSASCVIAHYCGPVASAEIGVMKEIYDLMGFGDPQLSDLKADLRGIKLGSNPFKIRSRKACYAACNAIYPTPVGFVPEE